MEKVFLAHAKTMYGKLKFAYDNAQDIVLELNGEETTNYDFVAQEEIKVVTNIVRKHRHH